MKTSTLDILQTTCSNAYRGFRECAQRENISHAKLLASYTWNCLVRDACSVVYRDVAGSMRSLLSSKQDWQIDGDEVVIAFPGLMTSTHAMSGLLGALEKDGKIVEPIHGRMAPWKNMFQEVVLRRKQVKRIMKKHKDRKVCMFGYSQGGYHAHRFGQNEGVPSISFGTPVEAAATPAGYALAYYHQNNALTATLSPDDGVQVVESFSFANPVETEGVGRIEGVHSHFPINRKEVIEVVIEEINLAFERQMQDHL